MSVRAVVHSLAVCKAILWAAAWLAPRRGRADWLAEWNAELWHVWRLSRVSPLHNEARTTAFCLGAFKDAFWLRRESAALASRPFLKAGTASRCMMGLALMAVVTVLIAYGRPGVWNVVRPYQYRAANDLVVISRGSLAATPAPTVSLSEFEAWQVKSRHMFTGLAFYQVSSQSLAIQQGGVTQLQLARASENLFDLLDVPLRSQLSGASRHGSRRIFLRHSFWADAFGSDPRIFGKVAQAGGQEATIAGVIPDEHWRLPGRVDAWLLEDAQSLDRLPPDSEGYVVGHAIFHADADGRRQMYVPQRDGGYDWFVCESLAEQTQKPLSTFIFALLLAALALPAITSFSLGEYPAENKDVPWATRIRRWAFLAVKFALLIPIVYFGGLDLAYAGGSVPAGASELIELFASFWGLLFGFGWALRDQRKRCPVCLRLLTNPARVGQFSRNFLAWHGTELVCLSGHGLLHVPDMATSWFGSQRWLYLDSSWSALFPVGT